MSASYLRRSWPSVLFAVFFALVILGPFLVLVGEALAIIPTNSRAWFVLAVPAGRQWGLLARSTALAGSVAILGMLEGVLVATVLWQWRGTRWSNLRWLVLLMAPVPAYVHALAWSSAMLTVDGFLKAHGLGEIPFRGLPAASYVELVALMPAAVGLALLALEAVPPALVEAGRLLQPDIRVFRRVVLPLIGPMILAAGGILFVLSLLDYSIPDLYQVNVYPLAIFTEYSVNSEAVRAFLFSFPVVVVALVAIGLSQSGLRAAAQRPTGRAAPAPAAAPFAWPWWLRALQALAVVVLALHIIVPVLALSHDVRSWGLLMSTAQSSQSEIVYTFVVAIAASLCCLPFALGAAHWLVKAGAGGLTGRGHQTLRQRMAWWIVLAPLAIPAPLVGIGLIALWNRPLFGPIYGSTLMPILASLARFTPLAALVMSAQLRRIDPALIEAARVLAVRRHHVWTQVYLPMIVPGLLAAAAVTFALTTAELGATLLVAPPGRATVIMRVYNYLHYGASDAVAGLCLIMAAVAVLASLIALGALAVGRRLLPEDVYRDDGGS